MHQFSMLVDISRLTLWNHSTLNKVGTSFVMSILNAFFMQLGTDMSVESGVLLHAENIQD